MMMTLALAHALLPGSVLVGDGATALARVHTDTRSLQPGDLFVALRGERFDGHDFLAAARAAGAAAALAEEGLAEAGMAGLQVDDSLAALQQLAAAWRARMRLPLAAVTGSNGKTTVTQMTGAILRAWLGEGALATQGSFNNHIGLPLTLLRLRQDAHTHHRAAVVEIGMNHIGEIAQLARLAAPTAALVNNAQREHQEFMGSVEATARENGSVIAALPDDGTVVIPADDTYTPLWRELAGARRVVTFALDQPATVSARAEWRGNHWALALQSPAGEAALALHMPGRHHAKNAVAACALAQSLGAPLTALVEGIGGFRPVAGRSVLHQITHAGRSVALVDDSYNANPDSVAAAIDVLAGMPSPRWLVLGDMAEVGAQGPAFHQEAGELARARGIEHLWAAGTLAAHAVQAFGAGARHFVDVPALLAALGEAPAAASVLVKGSRSTRTERVVQALLSPAREGQEAGHAA